MCDRLSGIGIERAKNDADKAQLLAAISRFAVSVGDDDLAAEADRCMPAASPFYPPAPWLDSYRVAFESWADEDRGTYAEEADRYAVEYWQALTDAERATRLQEPTLGSADGRKDAEALNSVDTSTDG